MSLVGFKSNNHPQQVSARGASDAVDERITPQWLFDSLNARFNFEADGLNQPWAPHSVWCNPPFSNLAGWVDKAWREYRAGATVVMLLPSNRTEQRWWQELVEPYRDGKGPIRTEFLARRINFGKPGNEAGKYNSSTPFGLVLLIFDPHEPPQLEPDSPSDRSAPSIGSTPRIDRTSDGARK